MMRSKPCEIRNPNSEFRIPKQIRIGQKKKIRNGRQACGLARYDVAVIKSLIILALLVVLAAGSALSRPSEESFRAMYKAKAEGQKQSVVEKIFSGSKTESYLSHCKYKNRIFWADVEYEGQTIYTGAFSHWFARGSGQTAKS